MTEKQEKKDWRWLIDEALAILEDQEVLDRAFEEEPLTIILTVEERDRAATRIRQARSEILKNQLQMVEQAAKLTKLIKS